MNNISKIVLENGSTVLVYPMNTIPKVAVQLWYGVGSKDEQDNQKGLAHLLEHMIFKGTDILSESDINLISHKLSGNCNAFTSYDYTCYIFDFPKQNWHVALPLLANCMRKCTFKEDLLNSELKAVIQELKLYKDDYNTSLAETMLSAIFQGHPYHYPIIGYKQDLWSITREKLLSFYHQHYIPNNATLVIVGDVQVQETFELTKKAFSSIVADDTYKKTTYEFSPDIIANQVVLRRDIQQPIVMFAWVIPGLKTNNSYLTTLVSWILGEGKNSRLYKILADEHMLVTDMQVDVYELFDQSILFVHVDPIDVDAIAKIEKIIIQEIHRLGNELISDTELERACKQTDMMHISLFENIQKVAYEIGKLYLATKKETALFDYKNIKDNQLKEVIQQFFKTYLVPSRMHKGMILPLSESELKQWLILQEKSDQDDQKILKKKVRESVVECGAFVEQITINEVARFHFPQAKKVQLTNGLTLLWHSTNHIPKIDLVLDLKMRHHYDPDDKEGLINFMSEMMLEGTQKYPDQDLINAAELRGITIDMRAGIISMSMLKEDFEFGLALLVQIVTQAEFAQKHIEKIRTQIKSEIAQFWDNPNEFVVQLVRSALYKNHPYRKNLFGDLISIEKITRNDLIETYHTYISPQEARLAIVGDLSSINIQSVVESILGTWQGPKVAHIVMPQLPASYHATINHPISRDQTVLCFAGHSVTRLDKLYDALHLFDQIFTGGVLGSMSSYLFQLREQSGLFYTIGGSLVANADEQPGIVYIRTLVSNDRLNESEQLIEKAIAHCSNKITQEDIDHARNAIINSLVDHFESNHETALAFLFIDRFNLSPDYFETRWDKLRNISMMEIMNAVKDILDIKKLIKVRIGRI